MTDRVLQELEESKSEKSVVFDHGASKKDAIIYRQRKRGRT